jgi:hypothetical protein
MWQIIKSRLREPSTWIGLSVLATIVGIPPGTIAVATKVIGAVGAIAGVAIPENKS